MIARVGAGISPALATLDYLLEHGKSPVNNARDVDRFFREPGGIVRYKDLAGYESRWEESLGTSFHGYDVYTCDGWSQGPRIVLMLNMLENQDLRALGYNTPEYIHLVSQVINLAMSDAHQYVGDPDFAPAPEGLYGKNHARAQRADRREERLSRMGQFNLDPELANVMAPGKRPRPASGSEVNLSPAVLRLEDRIPTETAEALWAMGHDVQSWGLWNWRACAPTVTWRDPETGLMIAAGDVRRETASLVF